MQKFQRKTLVDGSCQNQIVFLHIDNINVANRKYN